MRQRNSKITRRTALKQGGLAVAALGVGIPVVSTTVTAQSEIPTMVVDVPPVIPTDQQGEIVAAIYPNEGGMDPADVINHHNFVKFKLGPNTTDVAEIKRHADSVRHRLLPNGNLGVFFDSSTADTWFTSADDEAKISGVTEESGNLSIIAWGANEVTVKATPSPN